RLRQLGEELETEALSRLEYGLQHRTELDEAQPGRLRRYTAQARLGGRIEDILPSVYIPSRERIPRRLVRHGNLDFRRIRTLYELLVEIRQVLGDQYQCKITREEEWIVGPFLKENQCASVLGRVHGCLGHRDHRLCVIDDASDPTPVSQPRAEIVLQNRENADG